jgi:DNA-binding Xre family transcriptional regulator
MTVKLKVRELAEQLGIENAGQLAALTGIGRTSAYQIWNGEADMIALETINRLCKGLAAQPAALFDFVPEPDDGGRGQSLLERIKKVQQVKRGRPRKRPVSTSARAGQKRHATASGRR